MAKRESGTEQRRRQEAWRREQRRLIVDAQHESDKTERGHQREQARLERERHAAYVAARQAEAAELADASETRMAELSGILHAAAARRRRLDFTAMRRSFTPVVFTPALGSLVGEPMPEWADYQPTPSWWQRFRDGRDGQAKATAAARLTFEQDLAAHGRREQHRCDQIEHDRARHQRDEQHRLDQVDAYNSRVEAAREAFTAGDMDTVERLLSRHLSTRSLPAGIPSQVQIGYRPDSRQALALRALPDTNIVPTEKSHRHVKSRDVIESTIRKPVERHDCYAGLLAQLALITLLDLFTATSPELVDEVTVDCQVDTRDRATGQPVQNCLLSVAATRAEFDALVLDELDPQRCLRGLNALLSPNPLDVEPVTPLFTPDLSRFRTVEARDIAAHLDSRTVLTKLDPHEFEHLVRELFEAMGVGAWVTQASRDDGVDAVARNSNFVTGGVCVIQAKRYKKIVPADAVRALWGVMEDKRAATGFLVTTSYVGKTSHEFAARKERLRIIEGPELKALIAEHLGLDVLVGAAIPPNRRSA